MFVISPFIPFIVVLIIPSEALLIFPFKSPVLLIVPLFSIDLPFVEIILPALSITPLLSIPPVIEPPAEFVISPFPLFVISPSILKLLLIVLLLTTSPSTLPSFVNAPLLTVVPVILPSFAIVPSFVTVLPAPPKLPPLLFNVPSEFTVTSLFILATFSTSPDTTVSPSPSMSLLFVPDVNSNSPLFVTGFPLVEIMLLASVINVPSLEIVSALIVPLSPLSV